MTIPEESLHGGNFGRNRLLCPMMQCALGGTKTPRLRTQQACGRFCARSIKLIDCLKGATLAFAQTGSALVSTLNCNVHLHPFCPPSMSMMSSEQLSA